MPPPTEPHGKPKREAPFACLTCEDSGYIILHGVHFSISGNGLQAELYEERPCPSCSKGAPWKRP